MADVYEAVLDDCESGRAPTAAEVVHMVDETAKSVMRMQGHDPAVWVLLPEAVRNELRLLALARLRSLA
jgi:hypothetical protein